MSDGIEDLYSPENIERSRGRARWFRARALEVPQHAAEYLRAAAAVENYADEREREAARRERKAGR